MGGLSDISEEISVILGVEMVEELGIAEFDVVSVRVDVVDATDDVLKEVE